MKLLYVLAAALWLTLPMSGQAETVDGVAAVVNNEIITTFQLQQELRKNNPDGAAVDEKKRRQVLDGLIENTLILQRINELGLKVSDEELEAAIQDVLKQNKLTRPRLEEVLHQQGMSFTEYQDNLRKQILRFKLVGREVQSKIEVTNQEIAAYFRQHIDSYRQLPSLRLSRLSFPLPERPSTEEREATRAMAEKALKRLRAGEDFNTVLADLSTGGKAEGGDMGTFKEKELTSSFAQAVQDLKEGEISDIIETPQGFHLLQVAERHDGKVQQFDSVKGEITEILTQSKTQARLKEWSEELKKSAHIEIRI